MRRIAPLAFALVVGIAVGWVSRTGGPTPVDPPNEMTKSFRLHRVDPDGRDRIWKMEPVAVRHGENVQRVREHPERQSIWLFRFSNGSIATATAVEEAGTATE